MKNMFMRYAEPVVSTENGETIVRMVLAGIPKENIQVKLTGVETYDYFTGKVNEAALLIKAKESPGAAPYELKVILGVPYEEVDTKSVRSTLKDGVFTFAYKKITQTPPDVDVAVN